MIDFDTTSRISDARNNTVVANNLQEKNEFSASNVIVLDDFLQLGRDELVGEFIIYWRIAKRIYEWYPKEWVDTHVIWYGDENMDINIMNLALVV